MSDAGETDLPSRGRGLHLEEDWEERPPRKKREPADLDITPMIDVTFLLLIFFMVTSTMRPPASADLPPARTGAGTDSSSALIFTLVPRLDGDPQLEIPGGRTLPVPEAVEEGLIRTAVEEARDGLPPRTNVVVNADRDTPERLVADVLREVAKVEGVRYHVGVRDR